MKVKVALTDGRVVSDEFALALSRAVRAERVRLGLSQADLANRVGLGRVTVSQIETGARRLYADELDLLCEALEVSLDDLLHRAPATVRHRLGLDR